MNYWLLTTEYPPLYGGGISTYCFHTAKMLEQQGYMVTVFVPDDTVKDYVADHENGIRVIRFGATRTGMEDYMGYVPRLSYETAIIVRDIIRKEGKPDCIESQEYLALPYYVLQFKWLKYPEFENVPVVLTLHSPAFLYLYYNREGIYEFPNYWIGEMEASCIAAADQVIAPSRYVIDEIKEHIPVDESRITVVRNPYNVPDGIPVPPIERNKIVFYGKLSPQKGVFEMFSYFRAMWDDGFPYPLTVIGGMDKVYYPEMKTMGQIIYDQYDTYIKRGLIQFTGMIPPARRDEYLAGAHVILVPSLSDNLPYTAIEAMSIGKIVLASVQGGQSEIIQDGENGFLFDHRTPGSFAKKLQQVLSLDDDAVYRTGRAAMASIRRTLHYDTVAIQKSAVIAAARRLQSGRAIFPFTRNTGTAADLPRSSHIPGLLSVVVPYYNMGDYIEECMASILASGRQPIEIIIVNDGSTDQRSIDILEKWYGLPGITIVHKPNEGLALARNHGAGLARGSFLAFLDPDDKVHPDYYSKAIAVLEQYDNVHFAGAWVQYFGGGKDIWPTWNPEPPYILLHNSVNSSSLVYKTAAWLNGGINDSALEYGLEDYESVISMLHHGYRGIVLPECLFCYRIRRDSMFRSITKYKAMYSYQYISRKHAALYEQFASQLYNLLNANGPSFAYDNPTFGIQVTSHTVYPSGLVSQVKNIVKRNPSLKKIVLRAKGILKV